MPPVELQEFLWQDLFLDPAQWWDNRRSKPSPAHPDFKHKKSKIALWVDSRHKPAWVDSLLATWDHVSSSGSLAARDGRLQVRTCTKVCADGVIAPAVDALDRLVQRGCHVASNLLYHVLKTCIAHKDLVLGRRIHALCIKSGYEGDAFLATHLMGLYASHGRLEEAMGVFSKVPAPDVYNWATIIFAYANHGEAPQAVKLYQQMRASAVMPDNRIYVAVLKACAIAGDLVAGKEVMLSRDWVRQHSTFTGACACVGVAALHQGRQLHEQVAKRGLDRDVALGGTLVNMYAKCGSLEDARTVFDGLLEKNVVSWTAMIAGYAQQGMGQEALSLYDEMRKEGLAPPDSVTFVCLLQACASVGLGALHHGKQLHAQIEKRGLEDNVVLGGSLVSMYGKCGSTEDARRVFDSLPHKNLVTWNAMIAGYAQQGLGEEALKLYSSMRQEDFRPPDSVTFVCLLQACASMGARALHQGKQLHAQMEERGLQDDVVLCTGLIDMYAKCGSLKDARNLFDRIPDRNVVTWTAMIAGYAEQGMGDEALTLHRSMQEQGIAPNYVTYVCLLQACAIVAALPLGKHLHAQIEDQGLHKDVIVGTALVNMYSKCGSMVDSLKVFDSLPERSKEAWGALIGGYSRQGDCEVVFDLLDRMRLDGVHPNGITFLGVLTVCSHAGLLDKGRKYFDAMTTDYGICPTVEHYTCVVDLLGRAGHVEEALQVAETMPFPPDAAVWLTLLSACRKWKNVKIGQQAFEHAVSVDAKDASAYVLMSNIYASAQMEEEAKAMKARRLLSGAWKTPGQSWWTDVTGVVHTFVVGDKSHPESEGIYARLTQLFFKIKKEGYVPHLDSCLRDIPDEEKELELRAHSEKLAIAYALNRTPAATTIRVVKNLRVCMDCHTATAYISKVEKRTIICRDASRFHVYNDGKCSCGDYW